MAHRTLYLVRHGQYDPEDKSSPLGGGLTAVGLEQVCCTAELFAQVPVNAIFTSRLTRAVETARLIAARHAGLEIREIEHLKEISPPLPYLALKWMKDQPVRKITRERKNLEKVFNQLFKPAGSKDEYEVVICHGNVIRYFACRVLQVPPAVWMSMEIYNASITSVEIDRYGNSILLSYNESGHLSERLKTENLTPMGAGFKYMLPEKPPRSSNGKPAGLKKAEKS